MGHSSLLNYRLLKNMTNLEAMIRILNVKGIWNLDDLNTQQFALFQSVAPSEECRAHTCVLVSIYLCWWCLLICDLNTSAGEHLYVLEMCVCVLCVMVCECVFKLLAGQIKYS